MKNLIVLLVLAFALTLGCSKSSDDEFIQDDNPTVYRYNAQLVFGDSEYFEPGQNKQDLDFLSEYSLTIDTLELNLTRNEVNGSPDPSHNILLTVIAGNNDRVHVNYLKLTNINPTDPNYKVDYVALYDDPWYGDYSPVFSYSESNVEMNNFSTLFRLGDPLLPVVVLEKKPISVRHPNFISVISSEIPREIDEVVTYDGVKYKILSVN